jgi:excisionase family DNA binding protein
MDLKDLNDKYYLSTAEIAKLLNVSTMTIRGWLREKKLPGIKISKKDWRIKKDDFLDFLKNLEEQQQL